MLGALPTFTANGSCYVDNVDIDPAKSIATVSVRCEHVHIQDMSGRLECMVLGTCMRARSECWDRYAMLDMHMAVLLSVS